MNGKKSCIAQLTSPRLIPLGERRNPDAPPWRCHVPHDQVHVPDRTTRSRLCWTVPTGAGADYVIRQRSVRQRAGIVRVRKR